MKEHHPFLIGYTIGSLGVSVIALQIVSSSFGNPTINIANYIALVLTVLLLIGSIWLLVKSDSMNKWTILSDGQKVLASIIMVPGFIAGFAVIFIIAAIRGELGNQK